MDFLNLSCFQSGSFRSISVSKDRGFFMWRSDLWIQNQFERGLFVTHVCENRVSWLIEGKSMIFKKLKIQLPFVNRIWAWLTKSVNNPNIGLIFWQELPAINYIFLKLVVTQLSLHRSYSIFQIVTSGSRSRWKPPIHTSYSNSDRFSKLPKFSLLALPQSECVAA